jgi:hypothetical protein
MKSANNFIKNVIALPRRASLNNETDGLNFHVGRRHSEASRNVVNPTRLVILRGNENTAIQPIPSFALNRPMRTDDFPHWTRKRRAIA